MVDEFENCEIFLKFFFIKEVYFFIFDKSFLVFIVEGRIFYYGFIKEEILYIYMFFFKILKELKLIMF